MKKLPRHTITIRVNGQAAIQLIAKGPDPRDHGLDMETKIAPGFEAEAGAFAGCIRGDLLTSPADYDRTATWTAGTTALDEIRLGGGSPMAMVVGSVILRSREEILAG